MMTKLMIIQKISTEKAVDVFQAEGNNFQWTFESGRLKKETDTRYYPFVLSGHEKIVYHTPESENKLIAKNGHLIFIDDYCASEGTVIGILFPAGFIPDIIKFKDKPYVPPRGHGHFSTRPPELLQVFYNHPQKQAAVTIHLHEPTLFGFKCIARKVPDEKFPHTESISVNDLFNVSLSREFLNLDVIRIEDLALITNAINKNTNVAEIQELLNELLKATQENDHASSQESLGKLSTILVSATGRSGISTSLIDSYGSGGAAMHFIHRVLEYIVL